MAEMVSSHLTVLGGSTERERRRSGRPAGPPVAATIAPRGGAASGLSPSAPAPPTRRVRGRPRRRRPRGCRHPSRCYRRRWTGDGEAATAAVAAQLLGRGRGLGVPRRAGGGNRCRRRRHRRPVWPLPSVCECHGVVRPGHLARAGRRRRRRGFCNVDVAAEAVCAPARGGCCRRQHGR